MLNIFGKVIEVVTSQKIQQLVEEHGLLLCEQRGARKKSSTESGLDKKGELNPSLGGLGSGVNYAGNGHLSCLRQGNHRPPSRQLETERASLNTDRLGPQLYERANHSIGFQRLGVDLAGNPHRYHPKIAGVTGPVAILPLPLAGKLEG